MSTTTPRRRRRPRRRIQASASARGYGHAHQKLRRALLAVMAPGQPCPRCGQPMWPWQRIDLGHTDGKTAYQGLEHASCNRSAGAAYGNRLRSAAAQNGTARRSRRW